MNVLCPFNLRPVSTGKEFIVRKVVEKEVETTSLFFLKCLNYSEETSNLIKKIRTNKLDVLDNAIFEIT